MRTHSFLRCEISVRFKWIVTMICCSAKWKRERVYIFRHSAFFDVFNLNLFNEHENGCIYNWFQPYDYYYLFICLLFFWRFGATLCDCVCMCIGLLTTSHFLSIIYHRQFCKPSIESNPNFFSSSAHTSKLNCENEEKKINKSCKFIMI